MRPQNYTFERAREAVVVPTYIYTPWRLSANVPVTFNSGHLVCEVVAVHAGSVAVEPFTAFLLLRTQRATEIFSVCVRCMTALTPVCRGNFSG